MIETAQLAVAPPLSTLKLTVTELMVALVLLMVTVGTSTGTTALLGGLGGLDLPSTSIATTVNVYDAPSLNPVNSVLVVDTRCSGSVPAAPARNGVTTYSRASLTAGQV